MHRQLFDPAPRPLPTAVLAVLAAAAWVAWLGWDQHRDIHPDGSSTGPYEVWQVAGLVLTLLVPVCWAAARRRAGSAVLGTTVGLAVAACADWSDDASGLFAIGVIMVMTGTFVAAASVSALVVALGNTVRGGRRIGT